MDKKFKVQIGKYTISPMSNYPNGDESIWIEDEREGGQFRLNDLEMAIEKFLDKHF